MFLWGTIEKRRFLQGEIPKFVYVRQYRQIVKHSPAPVQGNIHLSYESRVAGGISR